LGNCCPVILADRAAARAGTTEPVRDFYDRRERRRRP
jgi:hypothetical protein